MAKNIAWSQKEAAHVASGETVDEGVGINNQVN